MSLEVLVVHPNPVSARRHHICISKTLPRVAAFSPQVAEQGCGEAEHTVAAATSRTSPVTGALCESAGRVTEGAFGWREHVTGAEKNKNIQPIRRCVVPPTSVIAGARELLTGRCQRLPQPPIRSPPTNHAASRAIVSYSRTRRSMISPMSPPPLCEVRAGSPDPRSAISIVSPAMARLRCGRRYSIKETLILHRENSRPRIMSRDSRRRWGSSY